MLGRKGQGGSLGFGGFLTDGTEIDGEVRFNEELRVDGKIGGRIVSDSGRLLVGESGQIEAEVHVGVASISGTVSGTLVATVRVEIHSTGKFYGDIRTPALIIEEGAIFEGQCEMGRTARLRVAGEPDDREETEIAESAAGGRA